MENPFLMFFEQDDYEQIPSCCKFGQWCHWLLCVCWHLVCPSVFGQMPNVVITWGLKRLWFSSPIYQHYFRNTHDLFGTNGSPPPSRSHVINDGYACYYKSCFVGNGESRKGCESSISSSSSSRLSHVVTKLVEKKWRQQHEEHEQQ
jgi:hypothetical protein